MVDFEVMEDNEQEVMEQVTLEDLSKEQLIDLIMALSEEVENVQKPSEQTYVTEPIDIDMEFIKSKEFAEGVKSGSKLVGIYTALVNSGISIEVANEIILNEHTYKLSAEVLKEQGKVAKKGVV